MTIELILKDYMNSIVFAQSKGVVMTGPFAGMRLTNEISWPDGNIGTKLLGCYEQELHDFVEEEISRLSLVSKARIVDIGCAEGYYAVGMALRLPNATVYGFDTSAAALAIAQRAAELNNIKIIVDGDFAAVMDRADLVISDCEGAELQYLDMEKFPGLSGATILVECHDFGATPITEILRERFSSTHTIKLVIEGARNPNQFEFLKQAPSFMRWVAVSEGRPCMMNWLLMRPL